MRLDETQIGSITGAISLFGIGVLFLTGFWWPGMMFVFGVVMVVTSLLKGEGWYGLQGGAWAFGFGVWALCGYSMAVMLMLFSLGLLLSAFIKPPLLAKPYVDNTLE